MYLIVKMTTNSGFRHHRQMCHLRQLNIYICYVIVGHMWKCNLSANMIMCFEMLKTSLLLLKIKLKLYYTVQGKKHILIKKEKSWEIVSKHSSVA